MSTAVTERPLEKIVRRIHDFFLPPPKPKHFELRFMTWAEADKLLREKTPGWQLAIPEEHRNRVIGMVYLERVETPNG